MMYECISEGNACYPQMLAPLFMRLQYVNGCFIITAAERMGEKGYKKTGFLLACVSAAKKNSLDATYRRYDANHKMRREADRRAAMVEQEKDFLSKQMS